MLVDENLSCAKLFVHNASTLLVWVHHPSNSQLCQNKRQIIHSSFFNKSLYTSVTCYHVYILSKQPSKFSWGAIGLAHAIGHSYLWFASCFTIQHTIASSSLLLPSTPHPTHSQIPPSHKEKCNVKAICTAPTQTFGYLKYNLTILAGNETTYPTPLWISMM